jgi:hypothetical protein
MQSPWRRGDGRVEGARPGAGYTLRAIPRNDLLTSVAELVVVAVA